jgi:prephenate dehydrogenase
VRVAFLGMGLIGGSVARALRRSPEQLPELELVAWTPDGRGPRAAAGAGVVDTAAETPDGALVGAALVVLAGPADVVVDTVVRLGRDGDLRGSLDETATVTDVASTKGAVVDAANAAGLRFVGGHPMAGREASGFDASDANLFVDRPWVVVPGGHAGTEDIARVEWLASTSGARPIRATARDHDDAVAAISHMPLVVAAALAEAIAEDEAWSRSLARSLATTGWQSATRLAHGDPAMGAGLLSTNRDATSAALRRVRAALDAWIEDLDDRPRGSGSANLRGRLERARAALER